MSIQGWILGFSISVAMLAVAPAGRAAQEQAPPPPRQVPGINADIPARCLTCHSRNSTMAPSFAPLLDLTHLTGNGATVYLSLFQSECTYCHKLDKATGAWSIPSGPEPCARDWVRQLGAEC